MHAVFTASRALKHPAVLERIVCRVSRSKFQKDWPESFEAESCPQQETAGEDPAIKDKLVVHLLIFHLNLLL
jgi:hypothetical protein